MVHLTEHRQSVSSAYREAEEGHLFEEYWRTRDPKLRERLLRAYAPLVRSLAARFVGRGEPLEDLIQVGMLGLMEALKGFEPERGLRFHTYAIPTIVGEIRHYFRDKGWHLTVPRRMQELNRDVIQAREALSQQLGRSPTIAEIATHVGATEEETLQAIDAGKAYEITSLDSLLPVEGEEAEPVPVIETVGRLDPNLQAVERRLDLEKAMASLDRGGREVLALRFFQNLSQAEVARRLGVSQMQVSRLQRRALDRLKRLLSGGTPEQRAAIEEQGR